MREESIFIEVLGMLKHIHFNSSILSELWALLADGIVKSFGYRPGGNVFVIVSEAR